MERTRFQGEATCCPQTVISGAKYLYLYLSLFRSILSDSAATCFGRMQPCRESRLGAIAIFEGQGGTGKGAEMVSRKDG